MTMKGRAKPTIRHKKAISILVEKGGVPGLTMGKVLKEAGYSKAIQHTPQKVTETKGFLQLANDAGLTDEFLLNCLQEDIISKPRRRTEELKLAGKWRGLEKQNLNVTVENVDVPDDVYKRIVQRAQQDLDVA